MLQSNSECHRRTMEILPYPSCHNSTPFDLEPLVIYPTPSQLCVKSPYYLVELKPAYGWLFREYLKEYSHWAFGDLDVLFGDMRKGWLEVDELQNFDIITFRCVWHLAT